MVVLQHHFPICNVMASVAFQSIYYRQSLLFTLGFWQGALEQNEQHAMPVPEGARHCNNEFWKSSCVHVSKCVLRCRVRRIGENGGAIY